MADPLALPRAAGPRASPDAKRGRWAWSQFSLCEWSRSFDVGSDSRGRTHYDPTLIPRLQASAASAAPHPGRQRRLLPLAAAASCPFPWSRRVQVRAIAGAPTGEATTTSGESPTELSLYPDFSEVRKADDGRRLQVQVVSDVAPGVVALRSLDWDRARFDIEFSLTEGTTYNSYLVYGPDNEDGTPGLTALIDASHAKFRDLWPDALRQELERRGRTRIDYLLISHTEPDHSGLVPDVVDLYPDVQIVGSKVGNAFLRGLNPGRDLNCRDVKGGETVDLGGGRVLEFVLAPNLHWPDTMFTYDKHSGALFTCDAFGAHLCSSQPYDVGLEDLSPHYAFYYDCLMRPNSKSVTTALRKLAKAEIYPDNVSVIATGHGPMLKYNLEELVTRYADWSLEAADQRGCLVLYTADYGYADRLGQTISRGVTKAGVGVEMLDLARVDPTELVAAVGRSDAVVLLSPPSSDAASAANRAVLLSCIKPKQTLLVAESFGGEDEPVDTVVSEMVAVGVPVFGDALRIKVDPDEAIYQLYEEAGTDLAQSLTSKARIASTKNAMEVNVSKALARVSGGLYVITAERGAARSAMIASWVSQASFEPPGLTVAVSKDRAIESLMQVGDVFALNVLPEGDYQPTMKHFLKRFPPGADRFEGVDHAPGGLGSPVLGAAVAHLECRVVSRLDGGDHWIVYATVEDGGVRAPDARTAVHRRKVASYY